MILKQLQIKLETTTGRYGSSGAKPTRVKSAASSKFKAISNRQRLAEKNSSGSSNSESQAAKSESRKGRGPLAYGTHSGNVHVYIIKDLKNIDFEEASKYFNYVDNITATFEAKTSFDIRKAKHDYIVARDNILKRYYDTYGSQPGDVVTAQMLNELKTKSFEFSKTQIVMSLTTDEYIEGSRLGKDGFYHLELRTKTLWKLGRTLLTKEEINSIISVEEDKAIEVTTIKVVVERYLVMNPTTGHYRIMWGSSIKSRGPSWE